MRILALTALAILCCTFTEQVQAQVPPGVIDFDRSVGFSTPRGLTVHPAYQQNTSVFIIPNGLKIVPDDGPGRRLGLFAVGPKNSGSLIVRLTPAVDGVPLSEIVSELKQQFPNIQFAVPGSKESRFEVYGPGIGAPTTSTAKVSGDPTAGSFVYAVPLPSIAVRALLSPKSYRMSLFAISTEYKIRGISRDSQGTPLLEDRTYRLSTTLEGFCALQPELVLQDPKGVAGCVHPNYDVRLVREVQSALKKRALLTDRVDGVFGSRTESAIRRFQRDNRLPVDGIPSQELLEFMSAPPVASSKTN